MSNNLKNVDDMAARIQNWVSAIGLVLGIIVFCVLLWVQVNKNTADIDDVNDKQKQMIEDIKEVILKRDIEIKESEQIQNDLENRIIVLETKLKEIKR